MGRWNGCKLVNPLCPDDLCILPPHPQWPMHKLGTAGEPFVVSDVMFMHPEAQTAEDLVMAGWEAQERMDREEDDRMPRFTRRDMHEAFVAGGHFVARGGDRFNEWVEHHERKS